jgi:hypothetical protein
VNAPADFVLSNAERFLDQGSSTPPVQVQVAGMIEEMIDEIAAKR